MLDSSLAGEIADRFQLGTEAVLTGPVARGEQGQVWRLDTSTGSWALKETFEPESESVIKSAAAFQDVAARAGVRVPRVLRTADGRVLLGAHCPVRVYEWVDLEDPDPGLDPGALGKLFAAIHRAGASLGPGTTLGSPSASVFVDPWYTDPVGPDSWARLEEDLRATAAPFATDFARMRSELNALDGWVEPPVRLQTCHRDLWADNVRRIPSGEICVIDWDNGGPADPGYELACALFEYCSDEPARAQVLAAAYQEAGGPGRVDRRGSFSMVIAQLGHIAQLVCQTWIDPGTSALERARTIDRFAEFTDRPLSRQVVHDLLDAVCGG